MRRWLAVAVTLVIVCAAPAGAEEAPGRKRRPQPQEYGRVVLSANATRARMAGVAFDHWVHRARYTCRVCHVDLGFAMAQGASNVRAADNARGHFCGACHDGRKKAEDGHAIFPACAVPADPDQPYCQRCHSVGTSVKPEHAFSDLAARLPRARMGNGIDWEAAERAGLIKPADFVEGVSLKRAAMAKQQDFALAPKLAGMPEIIFSHAKHTVWSGCEGCHPDPFGIRKGGSRISMADIFEGKYCGTCHQAVAFPTVDCQRCHSKPVQ
jgi:c(7)-type cytochrome triheme protein